MLAIRRTEDEAELTVEHMIPRLHSVQLQPLYTDLEVFRTMRIRWALLFDGERPEDG